MKSGPTSRVDALFTRLYERHGARFVVGHLAGVYAMVAVIGVLGCAIEGRLAQFGVGRTLVATALVELSLAVPMAWATWAVRGDIRTMMRWASRASPRDEQARAELIGAVFRFSPRFAIACLWRVLLFAPLMGVVLFGLHGPHRGVGFAVTVAFTTLMMILYGGIAGAFVGQLSLRPLRREAGASLSRGEFEPLRSLGVATKVRLGFVAALLVTSDVVVAIALPPGGTASLERAVWLSLLVIATLGLTLALPVTQNALDPVRDLIGATQRIAAGDLSADVPVTSTDELGELAASFNEMIDGLRERERLRDELRASRARIVAAGDAARRRVERDLHDGAQQRLLVVGLKLRLARRQLDHDPDSARLHLQELQGELNAALAELRSLAHGIYPGILESDGLPGAIVDAGKLATIPTSVECEGVGRYRRELEAAVYFCCLEALQNAAKHAGADARAFVKISQSNGHLEFKVADDGVGYRMGVDHRGTGQLNMRDRIGALGGTLAIHSKPGKGTVVAGTVPVAH
jgi:signal transduction histidine kinase